MKIHKVIVFLSFLLFFSHYDIAGFAQTQTSCSDLEIVFEDTSGFASTRPAVIVTDSSGDAHLFWLYKQDREDKSTWSINYSRWHDNYWSHPIDVLITPGGGASAPRVALSSDGYLHIIWAGGGVWYSKSHVSVATDARAWTKPVIISSGLDADITIDDYNNLHVVAATGEPGGPVYYLQSSDGDNWSIPTMVFSGLPSNATSMHPRISVDGRGRIHVTWTEYQIPEGWPPLGQWYIRSEDNGEIWDNAIKIGVGEQGQGTVATIGDDQIHLVWRGSSGAGNSYHQWSQDGGKNWSGLTIFDPDGGFSGGHTMAADSSGNLHLVRGDGGYQVWQNRSWSPVPALFADSGETGTLAIGLGNQVHWVNTTPSSSKSAEVRHRLCLSDSPPIDPKPVTQITPTPLQLTAPVSDTPTPTNIPNSISSNVENPSLSSGSITPLLIGFITPLCLIVIIILLRKYLNRG